MNSRTRGSGLRSLAFRSGRLQKFLDSKKEIQSLLLFRERLGHGRGSSAAVFSKEDLHFRIAMLAELGWLGVGFASAVCRKGSGGGSGSRATLLGFAGVCGVTEGRRRGLSAWPFYRGEDGPISKSTKFKIPAGPRTEGNSPSTPARLDEVTSEKWIDRRMKKDSNRLIVPTLAVPFSKPEI